MDRNDFSTMFLDALRKRCPDKSRLAEEMSEILNIEKVSSYRRLRGEIRLTFDEVSLLASRYDISLDAIVGKSIFSSCNVVKMFMPLVNDICDSHLDFMIDQMKNIKEFSEDSDTQLGAVIGTMPIFASKPDSYINKFLLFKWGHYHTDLESYKRFETTTLSNKLLELMQLLNGLIRSVSYSFYICNENFVHNFIRDIVYYRSMGLISDDDVMLLKEDLRDLLDRLEALVARGSFGDSGNRIGFYISSVTLDSLQLYIHTGNTNVYSLGIGGVNSLNTTDEEYCAEAKRWLDSMRDGAILISCCAERERIAFFDNQRSALGLLV